MAFINQAVTVLQTLVIALGAGLAVWGVVHPVLIKQAQLNRKVVEYWAVS